MRVQPVPKLEKDGKPREASRSFAPDARLWRRLFADRVATKLVTGGGFFVIFSIFAILFVIFAEVLPLFRSPLLSEPEGFPIASSRASSSISQFAGTDEYQEIAFVVQGGSDVQFVPLKGERSFDSFQLKGFDQSVVVAAAQAEGNNFLAATSDGGAFPFRVVFEAEFEGGVRSINADVEAEPRVELGLEPGERVSLLSFSKSPQKRVIAAAVGESKILIHTTTKTRALIGSAKEKSSTQRIEIKARGAPSALVLNSKGSVLFVGTTDGEIVSYSLMKNAAGPAVITRSARSGTAVSVLGFLLGDKTLVCGDAAGGVRSWMLDVYHAENTVGLIEHSSFTPHRAAVTMYSRSQRNKGFITGDETGEAMLRYGTSGETLLTFDAGAALNSLAFAPKANGIIGVVPQKALVWKLDNPHPEITWRTLFAKIWYEGAKEPGFVWQSTGATDDFESKLSLIPLIFGTLKGTLYALIFAIPIAVLAALYTSQFMHPTLKSFIKPSVELMAALPSVVIGFIAGLWLAPRVEQVIVGIFLAPIIVVGALLLAMMLWKSLPTRVSVKLRQGMEVFPLIFVCLGALWVSFAFGQSVERVLFGGSLTTFLHEHFGTVYDQRNCIVVGIAMGFAVIPIIYTITEDCLSSVPRRLIAASLALGATRWQTAVRVVLPSASPGIFSAIMIGFGRAVGETMIVLMATGNTPLLDWSAFNGFRALSANIAVELPEAPHGGTLYRVLFLTALLLFVMTFVVNTLSEFVRVRLRKKYDLG